MSHFAALIYWVIVAIWTVVLATVAVYYIRNPRTFGATRLLLAVVAVDTFRNIFENAYFGLYFGGQYGLFSPTFVAVLGQPALLIIPKALNVVAGCLVLGLLLLRWLPMAVKERGTAEAYADHLQSLAAIDGLTGLFNRRHFEALARAEIGRYHRYMRPLSLLLIDVDHFKSINDRFGHATGDQVLKLMADIFRSNKRGSDIVARIGGEEFAVLLPETTTQAAQSVAQRLWEQVRKGLPAIEGKDHQVTVSIGIASATPSVSGIEALLREADHALYEAKHSGRDRVCVTNSPADRKIAEAAE